MPAFIYFHQKICYNNYIEIIPRLKGKEVKNMQEFTKTIKLKLNVTQDQITLFKEMTEQYRKACNFISQYVFDNGFELNSNVLQKNCIVKLEILLG